MSTETFYSDLPSLENFLDITDLGNFVSIPPNWHIIVTDIVGSTKAIESKLFPEAKLRSVSKNCLEKKISLSKIKLENYLVSLFMKFKLKIGDVDWGDYKNILIGATDYKKFDDILRMVIAANTLQREKLAVFL